MEIPSLVYPYKGFHLGVKENNPNAEVSTTWLGTWEDVGKAKEAALALIDSGCDVVFGSADQATLGILQACREKGVWTFGAYGSQIPLAPEVVVGELLLDMKSAFVEVAKEVQGKTFKGGIIALGLKDKAVTFNWNDGLADKIPAEVRQAGEQAAADIESGKKQIPKYSLGEE